VQLGSLVALAMLVSSGSALLLLPAVVAKFRPRFLWAEAARLAPPNPVANGLMCAVASRPASLP
jgi:hypothetical protein